MKKNIWIILLVFVLASMLYGCKSDEAKIEQRLDTLQFAYNSGDMEGVLDCFDAKTRNANKAVLSVGNSLLGVEIEDLFALVVGLNPGGDLLCIEVIQITLRADGEEAIVSALMHYSGSGEEIATPIQLEMVKEKGEWYLIP